MRFSIVKAPSERMPAFEFSIITSSRIAVPVEVMTSPCQRPTPWEVGDWGAALEKKWVS